MIELRALVSGRVQGVGFRKAASTTALRLGLTGVVRNKRDGTVEIVAQGEKEHLREFIEKLQSIFDANFVTEFKEPEQTYPDFSIGF